MDFIGGIIRCRVRSQGRRVDFISVWKTPDTRIGIRGFKQLFM